MTKPPSFVEVAVDLINRHPSLVVRMELTKGFGEFFFITRRFLDKNGDSSYGRLKLFYQRCNVPYPEDFGSIIPEEYADRKMSFDNMICQSCKYKYMGAKSKVYIRCKRYGEIFPDSCRALTCEHYKHW